MTTLSPQKLHMKTALENAFAMSFDESKNFYAQKDQIFAKLLDLLCMPVKKTNPKPFIEYEDKNNSRFDEVRFSFESEPGFFIPAHLLLPKGRTGKLPLVICLQGHSSGMHRSIGRTKYTKDEPGGEGDGDFAIQAVKQGYACVAMEQRGFGELKGINQDGGTNCNHMAMQALILGRTLLGERCFDVSRLIDTLEHFSEIDTDKIGIMGNSGGGTASFYAACVDKRIKVCMPSCSFCPYYDSIIVIQHCSCNYIPGIYKYMDMQDLTILIAPRPLIVVAGDKDDIFPLSGVQRGFETVKKIYKAAHADNMCRLIIGSGGHRFYADISWPVFKRYLPV